MLDESQKPVGYIQYNYPEEGAERNFFKVRRTTLLDEAYRNKGVGIGLYEHLIALAKEKRLGGVRSDNKVGGGALAIWEKLQEQGYAIDVNPKVKEKWEEFLKVYDEGKFFREDLIVPNEESVFQLHLS